MYWLNILLLSADNDSEEGDSNISVYLFQELTQILVMEFKLYFTLLNRDKYKHSDLLNLVGLEWMSTHLRKKLSKDLGNE